MKKVIVAVSMLAALSLAGCKKGESGKDGTDSVNAQPAAADQASKIAEAQPGEAQPGEAQAEPAATPAEAHNVGGAAGSIDQSSPTSVMNALFAAAKSGDTAGLAGLCADGADGDSRSICGLTKDSPKLAEFQKYFASGAVQGEPRVSGDSAEVDFTFGPDGTKKETMKMTQKDGKWFLSSF